MIPVQQLNNHNPASGVYGDCFRTALASILELDPIEVPNYVGPDIEFLDTIANTNEWLAERGLTLVMHYLWLEPGFDLFEAYQKNLAPGGESGTYHFIVGGTLPGTTIGHVVVADWGGYVHDPLRPPGDTRPISLDPLITEDDECEGFDCYYLGYIVGTLQK